HHEGIARSEVKTMKPGSSVSGEHCAPWETSDGGGQPHQRLVGDLTKRIEPTAKAPPARRAEVVPGQSMAPGFRKVERPGGECRRNARSAGHGPGSCAPSFQNESAPVNLDD